MKQNKNNKIDGKLARMLRPFYQIQKIKANISFDWKEDDVEVAIVVEKDYDKKHYLIALDAYWLHNGKWREDLGVSVEGHKTWKDTVEVFIDIVKDRFWRDLENDTNS